jgi:hypothetical protein
MKNKEFETTTIAIYKEDVDYLKLLCSKDETYREKLHEIIELHKARKI